MTVELSRSSQCCPKSVVIQTPLKMLENTPVGTWSRGSLPSFPLNFSASSTTAYTTRWSCCGPLAMPSAMRPGAVLLPLVKPEAFAEMNWKLPGPPVFEV